MNKAKLYDEKQLLYQLKQNDEHALALLMKQYYNQLFNYASRFGACEMDVKDAVQEVFISLWSRREFADSILNLRFYLLKAIKNKILNCMQKGKKSKKVIVDDSILFNYSFCVDFTIEQKLINDELTKEIAEELKNNLLLLSHRQKEVIYLRFYVGLEQSQIASLINITRQSVYNLLYESLLKLKKVLNTKLVLQTQ